MRQESVVLIPSPDVVSRRLGDTTVLIHLRTDKIFELNSTGSRLWELLDGGSDRERLQHELLREFDVDREELAREIDTLVSSLVSEQLVTVREPT